MNKASETTERPRSTRHLDESLEEASRLAGSNITPADFYGQLLAFTVEGITATAGAVWMRTPQGFLQVAAQKNLESLGLDERRGGRQCHNEILRQVFQLNPPRTVVIEPQGRLGNGPVEPGSVPAANLTDCFVLFAPILTNERQCLGLLEVFHDGNTDNRQIQAYLQFTLQMAGYASQYHAFAGTRQSAGSEKAYVQVEGFARLIHTTLNPTECAYHVANEGRKIVEADRLSVGIRHGSKAVVEAVSGADVVEKSSTHVRRMRNLFDAVLKFNDKLIFTGTKDEALPPQLAQALDDYLAESQPKLLVVTPIRDDREKDSDKPARSVMLMEVFNPPEQTEPLIQRLEVVGKHAAPALYNAAELKRIPFKPLWWPVVKLQDGLGGKSKFYMLLGLALLVILTAVMIFVPAPLKMDAKGQYMPEYVSHVFPGVEGQVDEILILPSQTNIKPGASIARLFSAELKKQYETLDQQLYAEQLKVDRLQQLESQYRNEQNLERTIQLADAKAKLKGLTNQKNDLIQRYHLLVGPGEAGQFLAMAPRLDQLDPRFQNWGNITGSDMRESLTKRAVRPSEPLAKLGAVDGPWRVELRIPQRGIGHINRAFATEGQHFIADDPLGGGKKVKYLEVDVLFAGYETQKFVGKMYEYDLAIEAQPNKNDHNETEPITLAFVRVDLPEELREGFQKAGAEVRVNIRCGDHALGYSLFHGVWEWFYEKVLFNF